LSELEPEIHAAELPDDVVRARAVAEKEYAAVEDDWQSRIDAHLRVYREVIDRLVEDHRRIADTTDIPIGSDTRWSAMWEMAGRSLSVSRVLVHDLEGGFYSEADGTLRSLHEAVQLLSALHLEEDDLRRWLAGVWVRPAEARAVQERRQEYANEQMRLHDIEPEGGDLAELGRQIYSAMSASSHHERAGVVPSISLPLREYAYGPHPDPERRAAYINFAGELLEEVVLVVGDAFDAFSEATTTATSPDHSSSSCRKSARRTLSLSSPPCPSRAYLGAYLRIPKRPICRGVRIPYAPWNTW
jgi:hypothetical protein